MSPVVTYSVKRPGLHIAYSLDSEKLVVSAWQALSYRFERPYLLATIDPAPSQMSVRDSWVTNVLAVLGIVAFLSFLVGLSVLGDGIADYRPGVWIAIVTIPAIIAAAALLHPLRAEHTVFYLSSGSAAFSIQCSSKRDMQAYSEFVQRVQDAVAHARDA